MCRDTQLALCKDALGRRKRRGESLNDCFVTSLLKSKAESYIFIDPALKKVIGFILPYILSY